MEIGTILLYLALALGIGSLIFSIIHLRTRKKEFRQLARYLVIACFATTTITFLLLVTYFLTSDLHIEYVHDYTDFSYAWYYKLAGVWAGEKGTILLWTWLISVSLVIEEYLQYRRLKKENKKDESGKNENKPHIYDWARAITTVVLVAFIAFLISINMFKVTDPLALTFYPDGRGINPLLITPYMIVHPVLEFLAYAFTVLPLAAALSYLITNDRKWIDISVLWSRFAWLFYTLAIGMGALWAYNVLGWGGYWAWDPVETANLIPWIALTAFLHSQAYHKKRRQYIFVAPLLAVITFVLTLFATFETRSGYIVSVLHAFTGPTAGILDPGDKLVAILQTNQGAIFFMMMMLGTLIAAGILFIWRFAKIREKELNPKGISRYFPYAYIVFLTVLLVAIIVNVASTVSFSLTVANVIGMGNEGIGLAVLVLIVIGIPLVWMLLTSEEKEEEDVEEKESISAKVSRVVNDRNLMLITIVIFTIWFIITVLLMLMGVNGLEPAVFEDRLPLILVPLLIVLAVCLTWRYLGRMRSLYTIIILIMAAVIGFAVLPNKVIGIYIAILVAVLVAACYKIIKVSLSKKKKIGTLQIGGILLIIAGIIGMVTWANPTRLGLLSFSIDPVLWYAPLGFVFSVLALIGGISSLRGMNLKFSILGSVFGILSLGLFFAGTILSIIGLVLILASRTSFLKVRFSKGIRPILRPVSAHIIHIGIAFLVIGYVSSNYLSEEKDFNPSTAGTLTPFSPVEFKDYQIRLDGAIGLDTNSDGFYENMDVHVSVLKDGAEVGTAVMRLYWMIPVSPTEAPHYMIKIYVLAKNVEDIYFIGYAFNTVNDGWIQAQEDTGRQFTSTDVAEVAFQVKMLPLMGALWGGMWIMATGIVLVISTDYVAKRRKTVPREKLPERVEEPESAKRTGPEMDYDKRFEDELAQLEEEE